MLEGKPYREQKEKVVTSHIGFIEYIISDFSRILGYNWIYMFSTKNVSSL